MPVNREPLAWLLDSDEPWTRMRTRIDLLGEPEDSPAVQAERAALLEDARVRALMTAAGTWPGYALKRHNDANHPLYAISTLADFGLRGKDGGLESVVAAILERQDDAGPFLTRLWLQKQFGGLEGEYDAWMLCDAPTLLYALLSFGRREEPRVQQAVNHLLAVCREVGWPCAASSLLGRIHGPGRWADPCPIANVYALKALSLLPETVDSPATRSGTEMLLAHWQDFAKARAAADADAPYKARKIYLFGVGGDFQKLSIPLSGTTFCTWLKCSVVSRSCTAILASGRCLPHCSLRQTRMAAIRPARCTRPGNPGHSPTRNGRHPGSHSWSGAFIGGLNRNLF